MGQFRISARNAGMARRKAMRMRKGSTITKVNFIGMGTGRAKGKKMFAITAKRKTKR